MENVPTWSFADEIIRLEGFQADAAIGDRIQLLFLNDGVVCCRILDALDAILAW
jgi:hypothetical protein